MWTLPTDSFQSIHTKLCKGKEKSAWTQYFHLGLDQLPKFSLLSLMHCIGICSNQGSLGCFTTKMTLSYGRQPGSLQTLGSLILLEKIHWILHSDDWYTVTRVKWSMYTSASICIAMLCPYLWLLKRDTNQERATMVWLKRQPCCEKHSLKLLQHGQC